MKPVSQAERSAGPHQRQDHRPQGGQVGGAQVHRRVLEGRVEADIRDSRISVAYGSATTTCPVPTVSSERGTSNKREQQEEGDAQHDERHHQRQHRQAEQERRPANRKRRTARLTAEGPSAVATVAAPVATTRLLRAAPEQCRVGEHLAVPVEREALQREGQERVGVEREDDSRTIGR